MEHKQILTKEQDKFINSVQYEMKNKKSIRINKSQATAKVLEFVMKSKIDINEIIK